MAIKRLSFLLSVLFIITACSSQKDKPIPSLYYTEDQLKQISQKIETHDWAQKHYQFVKQIADSALTQEVVLPPRGGNWPHYYVDPEVGAKLSTGKYLGDWQWEHYNQDSSEVYRGDPSQPKTDYDGVVIQRVHHGYANKLFALALVYQLEENVKYLNKAKAILEGYIQKYPKYEVHDKIGGADFTHGTGVGKVTSQALGESVWLNKILQSLNLLWPNLDQSVKQQVEKNILNEAVRIIMKSHQLGVHNIQSWYDAAIGNTGFLLERDSLIDYALHDPKNGYERQLKEGLTPQGFWYERSPSYHFYALTPLMYLAKVCANNGISEYTGRASQLFTAPLDLMMPNYKLPRINDSRPTNLFNKGSYYEFGYSLKPSPQYLKIIKESRQQFRKKSLNSLNLLRHGDGQFILRNRDPFDFALLYGPENIEEAPEIKVEPKSMPEAGFDILTGKWGNDQTWLLTKYDYEQEGWHFHPDMLNYVLYYNGHQVIIDPGHAEYGAPAHGGWYHRTISHNTLMVNGEDHSLGNGVNLAYSVADSLQYSVLEAQNIYPDLKYRRAYLLKENYTLIIDDVRSEKEALLEINHHQAGKIHNRGNFPGWQPPNQEGYKYIMDATMAKNLTEYVLETQIDEELQVSTTALANKPVHFIEGIGHGLDFEDTPLLMARHRGKNLFMVWCINYGDKQLDLTIVKEGDSRKIRVNNQTYSINLFNKDDLYVQ